MASLKWGGSAEFETARQVRFRGVGSGARLLAGDHSFAPGISSAICQRRTSPVAHRNTGSSFIV